MGNRLKNKVAVVTGSGRGIGRGIALLLAEEGAKVVVNDLGGAADGTGGAKGPADEVVAEIKTKGGVAVPNYDSVTKMQGGENIIQTAVNHFGRIDILVNVAGILRDRMVFNMTEEEWDVVIAVHLKGHFACTKFASILMRQQRSGRIINFSSTSGLYGNSGQANYGAAKDGIAGFTRVCARDLGRYGVTVNCIAPAAATRLTATIPAAARAIRTARGIGRPDSGMTLEDQEARANLPQPGMNHPDDVAPFVVYLASDEAANINGHIFYAAGGTVSLLNEPAPVRSLYKKGRWTVDEIGRIFPSTLGFELHNPAPLSPPSPSAGS